MTAPIKAREKQIAAVLSAARAGCNTTQDIADVTGLSVATASAYVSALIEDGVLKRVGRTMPNLNENRSGQPFQLFEVVKCG